MLINILNKCFLKYLVILTDSFGDDLFALLKTACLLDFESDNFSGSFPASLLTSDITVGIGFPWFCWTALVVSATGAPGTDERIMGACAVIAGAGKVGVFKSDPIDWIGTIGGGGKFLGPSHWGGGIETGNVASGGGGLIKGQTLGGGLPSIDCWKGGFSVGTWGRKVVLAPCKPENDKKPPKKKTCLFYNDCTKFHWKNNDY